MKKQEFHLSIWLIFNWIRISFWFSTAIVIVFIAKTILLIFGLQVDSHPEHYLPIKFDVLEKGSLILSNTTTLVKITEASGQLQFEKLPNNVLILISLSIIPLFTASLLVIWLLKKFITNVKLGLVFKVANIQNLKKISYVLLAAWVYGKIIATIFYFFIQNTFVFESVKFQYTIGSTIILWVSLFIWVLSHVFQKGIEIEEENNLTI